jgi:C4-dicarboxylate-specific signal transduction histidine kinase
MGLLAIVQDVTARKTREEQVTERQMHLAYAHRLNVAQELARLIAHEINQPLCAISSYNEMCRDLLTVSGPALIERREDIAELVRLIGHHTSRVNDVIRKMRELVRKRMLERSQKSAGRDGRCYRD